jgi:hypothetical protein
MGIEIIEINAIYVNAAKQLVLQGLKERFGFLNPSLNPNLHDILNHYGQKGCTFLIGLDNNNVVSTGAISMESKITKESIKEEKSY